MRKNDINPLTTLHHVPLFASCTRKELQRIVASGDEVSFAAGKTLIEQGQPGREAFIVIKGIVSVRRNGRRIARLGAGAIVGELALLDNGPRTASVVCDTDVDVFVLDQRHLQTVLDEIPTLTRKLLTQLAGRVRELTKEI